MTREAFLRRVAAYQRKHGCDSDTAGYMVALREQVVRGEPLIGTPGVRPDHLRGIAGYVRDRIAETWGVDHRLYTAAAILARTGKRKDDLRLLAAIKSPEEHQQMLAWVAEYAGGLRTVADALEQIERRVSDGHA